MMLAVATLLACIPAAGSAQGLFGPGKFRIDQSDDRFSTTGLTTRIGLNNRVTKKTAGGGIYIDWRGLYLDPMVIKDRATGKLTQIGFILHHKTSDSGMGVDNTIGTPRRISFLFPDKRLIQADVKGGTRKLGRIGNFDRFTRSAESDITESGIVSVAADEMKALAAASSLAVHVEGEDRSWTIEAKDVSKPFFQNLAAFYQQEIAPNIDKGR